MNESLIRRRGNIDFEILSTGRVGEYEAERECGEAGEACFMHFIYACGNFSIDSRILPIV
jgi:hypothetical protein